jgi:hypothetical protein
VGDEPEEMSAAPALPKRAAIPIIGIRVGMKATLFIGGIVSSVTTGGESANVRPI